jgi:hypothetical protein
MFGGLPKYCSTAAPMPIMAPTIIIPVRVEKMFFIKPPLEISCGFIAT